MKGREVVWAARFKPRLSSSLVIAFNLFPSWAYHWPAWWERWGCLAISRCYPSLPLCSAAQSVWYVEVPWASLSFITRTWAGPGSLWMDVSFGLCFAVIHYKAMSGCIWGLGCLTLSFSWLSLCPFPCPRVAIQAYLVDDKPAEESSRAAQRKAGLWEDTGHNPTNEGMSISHRRGAGGGGWWQQTCPERFVGACLQSCSHSNAMGMLIISPILQKGKLRCMEINDLRQITQLENAIPGVKAS